MNSADDALRKRLLTVLQGLSSPDAARRTQAETLVAVHDAEAWRGALAADREWLLGTRLESDGWRTAMMPLLAVMAICVLFQVLVSAIQHAMGHRGGPVFIGAMIGPFVAVVMNARRATVAQVEALLARVGDDPRLVPLLLCYLPPAGQSMPIRVAWLARLARLLPDWHLEDQPLPPRAIATLRRELHHFASRPSHSEAESAFLMALLVSLDRDAPTPEVRFDLETLAQRHDRSPRTAEGAREAIIRLGGKPP